MLINGPKAFPSEERAMDPEVDSLSPAGGGRKYVQDLARMFMPMQGLLEQAANVSGSWAGLAYLLHNMLMYQLNWLR